MALQVPPETLWPTGATPPELAAAMHAEGLKTPEERRAAQPRPALAEVTGGQTYMPPPRPMPNPAQLELERQLHQVQMPLPPVAHAMASLVYNLPLGHGKHAEVYLYGPVGPADIKLLLRHIRLMRDIEPPPVASRPQEGKVQFTFEPNGTLSPKGKKPRKQA